ncbi:phage tail tape measure protein [Clostridium baratii]|uniref:Putative phage tail tape measure protein n=1 Tax=Clostridium baratii TaxID=1561 RepID=A0A174QLS6_9CLOT|nr:phage tail tape measure protein [Clostridium baratii]CUP72716.1 putative phage tail tape measure protein [Clostridium baratii]
MAGANVKIGANSSEFQRQMKEVVNQLKVTQSQFSLASEKAKLFGNSTDQLKAKQGELANKLKAQNTIVAMSRESIRQINKEIIGYKNSNEELAKKIAETEKKQKDAVQTYGKGSKEVKELDDKLKELKEQYSKNEKAIDLSNKRMDQQKIKLSESEKAVLKTKKAIEDNNKALEKMGDKFAKAGEKAGKVSDKMKPVSAGILGVGVASGKMAMDFEDGMAKVSTIADTSKVPIDDLRKGVLDLSSQTGKSATEMSEGLYQALSASVDTSQAINFMGTATKAAVGGFTDTATAVDGLSTVLNSYGLQAQEADKIANQMLITQNLGKTTFGELASSMGKITPITSQLNISTQELFSSLASTTAQGLATSESVTALKAAMSNIIKPSKEAAEAADELGIKFNLSELKSKGWMPFLQEVKQGLENASPALKDAINAMAKAERKMTVLEKAGKTNSKEYKQAKKDIKGFRDELDMLAKMSDSPVSAMAKMFGSVEGLNSILMLTSDNGMNIYNKSMKEMKTNSNALNDAYDKIANTTQYKFKGALNQGQIALIGLGDAVAPFISLTSMGISKLAGAFNGLSDGTKKVIAILGGLFVGTNFVLSGFSKLSKMLKDNKKFILDTANAFKNGSSKIKDFTKATKEGNTFIGKFAKGISNCAKGVANFTIKIVKSTVNGVVRFTKSIAKATLSVIKFTLNLVKAAARGLVNFSKGLLKAVLGLGKLTLSLIKNTAVLIKNGAIWVANKVKMLAFKAAQLAVTAATNAMTVAQKALNLAMSMNPITLVVTLLLGLAGVFVVLYTKCEWFRNGVQAVWSKIKSVFVGFANFLSGAFTTDWTTKLGLLGVPLNNFFGTVKAIFNGVKGVFNGLITFFKGVFTGNWREAFQGLSDVVSNIFGMIGGVIKAPINAAISGINWVISSINGIGFDVPSWVPGIGGSHFGIDLPQIPMLENGGIVTKATLAMVGEGKEHEAVMPLSKLDRLVTNSVRKVMDREEPKEVKEPKLIQINVQAGTKTIAQAIFDEYGKLIKKTQRSRAIARGDVI